jgi:TM2 domain-containing membrane protein YozV
MARSIDCPSCGNVFYETDEKCPYCGTVNAKRVVLPQQTRNYVKPMESAKYVGPAGRYCNKTAYVLIAIFLGWLGFHKFYAGKNFLGVLYLVFCWTGIPFIIGIIEGLMATGIPADEHGNIYFK